MTVTDPRDIVAALRAVPGVATAGLEPDAEGGIGVLRLGLQPGVDEVEVATAVGHLLRERFGLGVDADRVQVVDPPGTEPPPPQQPQVLDLSVEVPAQRPGPRPAISRLQLVSAGLSVTATVELACAARSVRGSAEASGSETGVLRAVATATLRAVEELVEHRARFELEHLEVTRLGVERTVVVSLTLLTPSGTERLTGAAGVREDLRQAVVRAVLDALNRRVETLLG